MTADSCVANSAHNNNPIKRLHKELKNELRYKVAIRFGIEGDLRFISHHDTMRLFERALSRASLPVKFSEGFNPHPRLSLPLPRSVGVASECDLLVIELSEPLEPNVVRNRLSVQLPRGLTLLEAWVSEGHRTLQVDRVAYALDLPPDAADKTIPSLARLLAAETWSIERHPVGRRGMKLIDLRSYLVDASVQSGTLRWIGCVTRTGSCRPAEVLEALGLDPQVWHHHVRRTAIYLKDERDGQSRANSAGCSDR